MVELIGSIILFSAFIGFFMEVYKKGLRRDNAGVWEIRVVATFMSLIFGLITYSITPSIAVKYSFVLIAFYTVLIYILQLPVCMKVSKPLIKKFIERR